MLQQQRPGTQQYMVMQQPGGMVYQQPQQFVQQQQQFAQQPGMMLQQPGAIQYQPAQQVQQVVQQNTMQIVLPEDACPGRQYEVDAPDGRVLNFTVPPGCGPQMTVN